MDNNKLRRKYRTRYPNQQTIAEAIGVKRVTLSIWLNGKDSAIGDKKLEELDKYLDD